MRWANSGWVGIACAIAIFIGAMYVAVKIDPVFGQPAEPTLIDRFGSGEEGGISSHEFSAAVFFWTVGEVTRAEVIAAFEVTLTQETQLDALQTYYGTLSATDKLMFRDRLESALILLEGGKINQTKFKSLLGL